MLSALRKDDLIIWADDEGYISAIEWEGHIVENADTKPGKKAKELLRIPELRALTGITFASNVIPRAESPYVTFLYVGTTTECFRVDGTGQQNIFNHIGAVSFLITELRVEYKDGRLLGLTSEKSVGVVNVDTNGFARFDETIKKNERVLAEMKTKIAVLEDRRRDIQKDIDQLNASNPMNELNELKKVLKDSTTKVGGVYDPENPSQGLSDKLQELLESTTEQREMAQRVFDRWRREVKLENAELSKQNIDETATATDNIIRDLQEQLRKIQSRNEDLRSKIFAIRNDITAVNKTISGENEIDPDSAMTNIRAYTYATELDRNYKVQGSRAARALELLSKIKEVASSKVVDDPEELAKLRNEYSKLVVACDTQRETLNMRIQQEKRVVGN